MHYSVILLLIALITGQCSSDKVTLEGGLSLFGAEPFVQLALITDDDERIFLDADKEMLNTLWKENQGRIKVQGTKYEGEWYGQPHTFLTIEEWEWITE